MSRNRWTENENDEIRAAYKNGTPTEQDLQGCCLGRELASIRTQAHKLGLTNKMKGRKKKVVEKKVETNEENPVDQKKLNVSKTEDKKFDIWVCYKACDMDGKSFSLGNLVRIRKQQDEDTFVIQCYDALEVSRVTWGTKYIVTREDKAIFYYSFQKLSRQSKKEIQENVIDLPDEDTLSDDDPEAGPSDSDLEDIE